MSEEISHTLHSTSFGEWQVIALESGMIPSDIQAVSRIRMRLISAVEICNEVVGCADLITVTSVFQEISREASRSNFIQTSWPPEE